MSNKRQRNGNRNNAKELKEQFGPKTICMNCGGPGRHFAPPCFGEEGFFTCQAKPATNQDKEINHVVD